MTGLLLKWVKKLSENECICTPSKLRVNEKLALATACVFNRVQPVHRLRTGFGANARTVSLKVVDDWTTLETDKRNGKTVETSRMTVSSDGSSATFEWTESCNANGDVVSGKDILSRVTKGPRGSHAVSGSWQISKRVNRSENALVVTLKLESDTFSFADPAGQSYAARLDGTETPIEGDLSNTMVSVRRIGENTIEETDKHDGKVVEVTRFTPSADGKTMTVSMEDKVKGGTRQFVCHKQ